MIAPAAPTLVVEDLRLNGRSRRLALFAPGQFDTEGSSCAAGLGLHLARCRLDKGRAMLLADADMMHDRMWVGPGELGSSRSARISDNPLVLADLLDYLSGSSRPRREGPVEWLRKDAQRAPALLLALLPLLAAAAPAATRLVRRRA
jgi:hypothetical protein